MSARSESIRSSIRRLIRKVLSLGALIVLGFVVLFCASIYFMQDSMIYFPRPYEGDISRIAPSRTIFLYYETSQGKQTAFYIPPETGERPNLVPKRLWVLFHGNASLSLDWLDFIESYPEEETGFLLVDFPGYGQNAGRPTPRTIQESAEKAFAALASAVETTPENLEARLNIMGFSLGAAAGAQFAVKHPPQRLVLLAPFTSMNEMAIRSVGRPLNLLLRHKFNNRKRLQELSDMEPPPEVHIFHGTRDDIIPFEMSQKLAEEFPEIITLHPVPNSDHNYLLDIAEEELIGAMVAADSQKNETAE